MELRPELWQSLESAVLFPETADMRSLFVALDAELAEQPPDKQLAIAGHVLAELCEVYAQRSGRMIEHWEQRHNPVEPVIDLDDCVELFVQSSSVVLDELFEEPGHQYPSERAAPTMPDPESSVVGEVAAEALPQLVALNEAELAAQVQALAHGEDVEGWSAAIVAVLEPWFAAGGEAMPLRELPDRTGLPFIEVWLGLLLGTHNFQLCAGAGFYDFAGVTVQSKHSDQGEACSKD